jgi:hypothetical protein
MGLDMYINSFDKLELDSKGNRIIKDGEGERQIAYYRKVNWLHNWMQQQYAKETGITDASEFNCVYLVMTKERLMQLQEDIVQGNISSVSGFFFGQPEIYPEQKQRVFEDIGKCLFELSNGKIVSYSSWW